MASKEATVDISKLTCERVKNRILSHCDYIDTHIDSKNDELIVKAIRENAMLIGDRVELFEQEFRDIVKFHSDSVQAYSLDDTIPILDIRSRETTLHECKDGVYKKYNCIDISIYGEWTVYNSGRLHTDIEMVLGVQFLQDTDDPTGPILMKMDKEMSPVHFTRCDINHDYVEYKESYRESTGRKYSGTILQYIWEDGFSQG